MAILKTDAALTPQAIEAKMHLPPNMQEPFKRIIVAGLKVMFDAKTHGLMLKELSGPGPMPQKLGLGVAGLMAMLFHEAQRSMPPQLLIPCGLVLLAHAAEFVAKAGNALTAGEFGAAAETFTAAILKAGSLDPAKVAAAGAPHV